MLRVPVISGDGKALMPTVASRARRWVRDGKAIGKFNKLGQYYVELTTEPSSTNTQPIAIGLDPGKSYSGIGVQSARFTLWTAHLILPFKTVRERMEQRRLMRRGRRGRRINRKLPYHLRAHRQKRFDNRRGHKLPPSIRANRELELRVVKELCAIYPISAIYFEYIEARGNQGFSPVMVGQKFMIQWLSQYAPVQTRFGWQTAKIRRQLKLPKDRLDKSRAKPETHAVDGVALACYHFIDYRPFHRGKEHGHEWLGIVSVTSAPFTIIRRPPISRRQLHLMVPAQGGVRRKYGGTTTRHGFRKGDLVRAEKAGEIFFGWVSGDTRAAVSVSNINWKRLAQFSQSKVTLLQRSTGLLCTSITEMRLSSHP